MKSDQVIRPSGLTARERPASHDYVNVDGLLAHKIWNAVRDILATFVRVESELHPTTSLI